MMGVGKSTVGKNLANKLSFKFIDIDKIIENEEGCKIDTIFKNKSENYFRSLESKITLRELKKESVVISLGGGAFLNSSIRRTVRSNSISFWLNVNHNILIKRLKKNKKRPLLLKKNLSQTVKKIYLERKKTYSEANFKINCDTLKPELVVNKIIDLYENSTSKI
tara:strand:- start:412 stop:906 length:495 start_codon:yes stop_codon:yes gene_type:complete